MLCDCGRKNQPIVPYFYRRIWFDTWDVNIDMRDLIRKVRSSTSLLSGRSITGNFLQRIQREYSFLTWASKSQNHQSEGDYDGLEPFDLLRGWKENDKNM